MNIAWNVRRVNGRDAWHQSERFIVRVLTGQSQRFSNTLEVLNRQSPVEGAAVYDELSNLANELSQVDGTRCLPNVPEIAVWTRQTSAGCIAVGIVFGIVLNGGRQGKLLTGDFKFVVVDESELEDCLSSVFNFEKVLSIEKGN